MNRFIACFVLVLLSITLTIAAASCSRDQDGESAAEFSGTVTDSVSAVPIDSALVSFGDTSWIYMYTDNAGRFDGATFGGSITIFIRKEGYETRFKDVVLGVNSVDLEFELPPSPGR